MREGDNGERGGKEVEEARLSHGGGGGGRGSYTHCMEDITPNFVGQCRKNEKNKKFKSTSRS